ncbi:MAG: hypothetical protein KGR19_05550 [Acidobacteria bacterium]|nr:hypothetical protein [Acidobacteriota bacterium]
MARRETIAGITDSSLYTIGATFCDASPDLVDDVLEQSVQIENQGIEKWARREGVGVEVAFQTLMTGLAVRFYTALAGGD